MDLNWNTRLEHVGGLRWGRYEVIASVAVGDSPAVPVLRYKVPTLWLGWVVLRDIAYRQARTCGWPKPTVTPYRTFVTVLRSVHDNVPV